MTSQNTFKRQVAQAALDLIRPKLTSKSIIGVGTGSTTDFFIDELANIRHLFDATVSSSQNSAQRLKNHGVAVIDLIISFKVKCFESCINFFIV